MQKLFFNKQIFTIIKENKYTEDYIIVTAQLQNGTSKLKHKFKLWNDGFVEASIK